MLVPSSDEFLLGLVRPDEVSASGLTLVRGCKSLTTQCCWSSKSVVTPAISLLIRESLISMDCVLQFETSS